MILSVVLFLRFSSFSPIELKQNSHKIKKRTRISPILCWSGACQTKTFYRGVRRER
jgi:hypothetical protein